MYVVNQTIIIYSKFCSIWREIDKIGILLLKSLAAITMKGGGVRGDELQMMNYKCKSSAIIARLNAIGEL